ncbi:MAG: hypothetical protein DMG74_06010 [Acidobacteria bacterium]|nr:MAG: hypothetical protein DMG75_05150 [Acidobacteriota bacterium]PYX66101.1 MAG: hypothetical protein DMG74_06010 [Acidobacteriota bacterium]
MKPNSKNYGKETSIGGKNGKRSKRSYKTPASVALTPAEAKAELEARAMPGDAGAEKMLHRISQLLESDNDRK